MTTLTKLLAFFTTALACACATTPPTDSTLPSRGTETNRSEGSTSSTEANATSTEASTDGSVLGSASASVLPPVVQAWPDPIHRGYEQLFSPQEFIGSCEPWLQDYPQPCATVYRSASTVMENFCELSDGLLSARVHTYAAIDPEQPRDPRLPPPAPPLHGDDAQRERYSVERDAQGRLEKLHIDNSFLAGGANVDCTLAYDGDSDRVTWQACTDHDRGAHFVYDAQGRLIERYDAEKKTSSIDELQAYVPPQGTGFWSYVYEYAYDDTGRLVTHRKCNGQKERWCYFEETLSYDADGRLALVSQVKNGETAPSQTVRFSYDELGRLGGVEESWSSQGKRVTSIAYDAQGRPSHKQVEQVGRSNDNYRVEIYYEGEACNPPSVPLH